MASGRMREVLRKYGKVGLGVHLSVSVASTAGLYVAIKNNVDVQSIFDKLGLKGLLLKDEEEPQPTQAVGDHNPPLGADDGSVIGISQEQVQAKAKNKKRNRTGELVASSGGALALALLCNKALFPVRVPITLLLTPPLARFLATRRIINSSSSSSSSSL